tara:strand:- start:156 stop:320 length:165 start_codon:yes stop_codon:yes gene_type:complete
MRIPDTKQKEGMGTAGVTGVVLMVLHLMGYVTGWYFPVIYIFLILFAIGVENKK